MLATAAASAAANPAPTDIGTTLTIDGNGSETIPENTTLADIIITLLGVDIDELDVATEGEI